MTAVDLVMVPAGAPDLAACEDEPIRIPGSIQPHGVMLVLDGDGARIVSASANAADRLGLAGSPAGQDLAAVLGGDASTIIGEAIRRGLSGSGDAMRVQAGHGGAPWLAIVHRHDGLVFVELEPPRPVQDGLPGEAAALLRLGSAAHRLQEAASYLDACQAAAEEIHGITGFGRVMVYRFAADWSGEVLGEARDADMASYLGLHFPASDIPAQARALYVANPVRLIADACYRPAPLQPDRHPATGRPIDLSFATLRSVSPIHLEYLRNMRVGASMSVSIIRDGNLWGLVACHHPAPHIVGYEARQACNLLAGMLAGHLAALDRVETAAEAGRVAALHARLLEETAAGHSVAEAVVRQARPVLDLLGASGFAMVPEAGAITAGDAPGEAFVAGLAEWLAQRTGEAGQPADLFVTDRLASLYPPARAEVARASGLLAARLSPGRWTMWFRREQAAEITWAGEPMKAATREAGQLRLHPRRSFASWTEEVRGRSAPWPAARIDTAMQVRGLILELTSRERDLLERQNIVLARSNHELETFIYVASHDIREPLRQMEMLASMLKSCVRTDDAGEAAAHFEDFRILATRLRRLTDELANYARPGRSDKPLSPLDLGEVVEEAAAQLAGRIREVGAEITVGKLPAVLGERAQLHQVFINILGNAMKYREPSRPLKISIEAVQEKQAAGTKGPARIAIRDNGIGFEPRYADEVFEPFMRLHPRDTYEGSGLGLAICRRIVERHGGRIEALAEPGAGTSFIISLQPATPAEPTRDP